MATAGEPTSEAAQLMDDLGLAVYDAQGNVVGIEAVAGQVQDRPLLPALH